jgi:hypothetical protein
MAPLIFCLRRWRGVTTYLKRYWRKYGKDRKERKTGEVLMRRSLKICLVVATLVALSLLAAAWATVHLSLPPAGETKLPVNPADVQVFYTIETVISTINVALLVILLITYVGIYRKTRSQFTIGLIIFSIVMLLNAVASNPFVRSLFGFHAFGLGPFAMLPDLFTLIALVLLLYLTFRY